MINPVPLTKDLSNAHGIEYAGSYFNAVLITRFSKLNDIILLFGRHKIAKVNCVTILRVLGHRHYHRHVEHGSRAWTSYKCFKTSCCRENLKGKGNVQR